ncbi:hypothetical protein ACH4LN_08990 [Streptomyces albus]|uniref:hypothetical protein n=1 Tax=Streptomyces albus TaxID=1888 RepID=UPI0013B47A72|nr:hypothetical protein [Streptomyces albus]QID40619.1 hypothetical protein G3260_000621 [Streptomyces albus]
MTEPEDDGGNKVKLSRPVLAAASLAGVLLLCSPFAIVAMVGGDDAKERTTAADHRASGGGDGFIPGADDPSGKRAADKKDSDRSGAGHGDGKGGKKDDDDSGKGSGDGSASGGDDGHKDGDGGKKGGGDKDDDSVDVGESRAEGSGSSDGDHSRASVKSASAGGYSAVAGPYCSDGSTKWVAQGRYSDGQRGWTTSEGGYSGSGCGGRYVSVPMSGSATRDDDNAARYTFDTGKVERGSCTVKVHIPGDSQIRRVGGHPTYYTVHDAANGAGSTMVGKFTVQQTSNRGSWVTGGTFPVNDGVLSVKLHTRGIDHGSWDNAHHAASAIRVSCSS